MTRAEHMGPFCWSGLGIYEDRLPERNLGLLYAFCKNRAMNFLSSVAGVALAVPLALK